MSHKNEYQSRWGFHHCNYSTYRKLKQLHRWYWETVYSFHRWLRWSRKEPQNRIGPEPLFCETFTRKNAWLNRPETIDHDVVDLYQRARMPSIEPVDLFDQSTLDEIEALYLKVSEYFFEF